MTQEQGSTVPRRQLGRELRRLREGAQITVAAAAKALEWSPQKIWRIEGGMVPLRTHDVDTMCRTYGAPPQITEALVGLATETKAKGWWHSYGDAIPSWFELYVGLESAASRIRKYEMELIPGLLQTKTYAKEMTRIGRPDFSEEERERRTAIRLERQGLLARRLPPPPQLDVILNEAVLRRPIHDRKAMAGQLHHLIESTDRPNVSVKVLPLEAGPHQASIAGAFAILDFPATGNREPEPSIVYSENVTGAIYLDKLNEIETYHAIWTTIDEVSLGVDDSRMLITTIAKEYERG